MIEAGDSLKDVCGYYSHKLIIVVIACSLVEAGVTPSQMFSGY